MKTGAIILNYNNSIRCINQTNKMLSFNIFDEVVLVDNASNINEKELLMNYNKKKVKVIYSKTNRGYGAGNNLGLRYLKNKNIDYVFLINPDNIVEKTSVVDMLKFIKQNKDFAVLTCPMIERGKIKRNFYDFPNLKNSFIDCVTIEKNNDYDLLNKTYTNTELQTLFTKLSKKCKNVKIYENYLTSDFVNESCTFYNLHYFSKINFFDEDFFMYEEGPSIGMNFKKLNYKVGILFNVPPYIHDHKGSLFNRKTFAAIKKSRIHFFKKYLKYPWYKTILIKILYINVYLK